MSDSIGVLLKSDSLKNELELLLPSATRKVQIISAYVTTPAMDWFERQINRGVSTTLVCRLSPRDVAAGSTDFSALEKALRLGWRVYCLHSLHAKIYCIDDAHMFVGSANFTARGLKVFGSGNLEACVKVPASSDNIAFVEGVISSSIEIDSTTIEKMRCYCNVPSGEKTVPDTWPDDILCVDDGIWVQDFFWLNPMYVNVQSEELVHDLALLGLNDLECTPYSQKKVFESRCVQWLIGLLKDAPEKELYFGAITQHLHTEMKDDPFPYRKEVKGLLQNLLAYIQMFSSEYIEVTRPNHSQKVKLIKTNHPIEFIFHE